jgi:hypothetical protein
LPSIQSGTWTTPMTPPCARPLQKICISAQSAGGVGPAPGGAVEFFTPPPQRTDRPHNNHKPREFSC